MVVQHWEEPRGGEGSPTAECAVETCHRREVLDQENVGIAPVVEDLAYLDVAAASPSGDTMVGE